MRPDSPDHARGAGGQRLLPPAPFWRLAIALAFLNVALTFDNLWPTPAIVPSLALSLEGLALALALVIAAQCPPARRARIVALAALVATALACGRYVEVTMPAFLGRPINLYWDGRHLPSLLALAWQQNPMWKSLAVAAGVLALLALVHRLMRRAAGCIAQELAASPAMRRRTGIGVMGVAVASLAVAHVPAVGSAGVGERTTLRDYITTPVLGTWARQGVFLATALSGARAERILPPSQPFTGDVLGLRGADLVLVFLESYGATAFDDPGYAQRLQRHRADFAATVAGAGREVLSAFVRSPTFGGGSWLAHASFLSGIEVSDPAQYDLLLTTRRPTLVGFLQERGYETIALMPGIRADWPEGSFYGFDELIDSRRLDYRGPTFGYWRIPDQYAMARYLERRRAGRPDRPQFLFFPTVTSHIPFDPVPPYQPDWAQLLGAAPYPADAVAQARASSPDWLNLGPAYADTLAYTYDWLTGYLAQPPARDYLLVIVGDHQPAASVSGRGASWEVPVHVVTADPALARRLAALGFGRGLAPQRPALGAMSDLPHLLLRAAAQD